MELREHAKRVFDELAAATNTTFTEAQRLDIIHIVEKELVTVVLEARNNCAKAALEGAGEPTDMAHEISRKIHRANQVLITNLASLR